MSVWLSKDKLSDLLKGKENHFVEKCESSVDTDKISKTICAFANNLSDRTLPCVLFIGVKDNGSCAGLSVTDKMLLNITSLRGNGNLQPFPVIDVTRQNFILPCSVSSSKNKTEEKDCELIVVQVQPSKNPPMRYKGACWVRIGPSVRCASREEEKVLNEKRQSFDLPEDMSGMAGADIQSDLNMNYFKSTYLPSAVSRDALLENHRDSSTQMKSLRLLDPEERPTVTALLIMGKNPRYWFPSAYIPGGPYGEINEENFGREGLTSYRNPSLAEALKNLGFIERFGFGIAQSRKSLKDNGNPELEFKTEALNILTVIKPVQ